MNGIIEGSKGGARGGCSDSGRLMPRLLLASLLVHIGALFAVDARWSPSWKSVEKLAAPIEIQWVSLDPFVGEPGEKKSGGEANPPRLETVASSGRSQQLAEAKNKPKPSAKSERSKTVETKDAPGEEVRSEESNSDSERRMENVAVANDVASTSADKPLGFSSGGESARASGMPLVAQSESAPGGDWPEAAKISYEASGFFRGPMYGSASIEWRRDGARYEAVFKARVALLARVSMVSHGRIGASGLEPEEFWEDKTASPTVKMTFSPGSVVVGDGARMESPIGAQDSASQFVELAQRFARAGAPLAVGQVVQMWLARPEGGDLWTYDVVGLEAVSTPKLGQVSAYHLMPRPLSNPRGPISAEMWFAPAYRYWPVRVKVALGPQAWVDLVVEGIDETEASVGH